MKKNLLTVLILALLLVNIALTTIMMISVMGTNKKTAQLVGNIATVLNFELKDPGAEESKEEVSLADTEIMNLSGSMMIPLAGEAGEKQTYMIFDMSLSLNTKNKDYKKTYKDNMANYESLIKDVTTSVVGSWTELECRNDIEGLKAAILKALQDKFQSDFIYDIGISGIKYG